MSLGQGLCSRTKALRLLVLTGKGFDNPNPREAFLQYDRQVSSFLLYPPLQRPQQMADTQNHAESERQTAQRQSCQAPIEPGHGHHGPGASQSHVEPCRPAKLEEYTDSFDIRRSA